VKRRGATAKGAILYPVHTGACRIENRALCVGYLDGQVTCPTFQRKVHIDVTVV
jgi:hypothetical protein